MTVQVCLEKHLLDASGKWAELQLAELPPPCLQGDQSSLVQREKENRSIWGRLSDKSVRINSQGLTPKDWAYSFWLSSAQDTTSKLFEGTRSEPRCQDSDPKDLHPATGNCKATSTWELIYLPYQWEIARPALSPCTNSSKNCKPVHVDCLQ